MDAASRLRAIAARRVGDWQAPDMAGLITHGILKWGDIPLACALSPAQLKWINPRKQDGSITEVPEKEILFCKQNLK